MDETRLTATLPTLTIDVIRRDLGERGEQVAVQITARPGFDAWEKLLAGPALPGPMAWMAPWLALNPFARLWLGYNPKPEPTAETATLSGPAGG
jgi:hypothetical protein